MVSADIYHRSGGEDSIIGRGSAKTVEDGILGKDDDLHSTISIVLQERLRPGDQVLVSMVIHGNHGSSKLDSDWSRKIIFTGLKISNWITHNTYYLLCRKFKPGKQIVISRCCLYIEIHLFKYNVVVILVRTVTRWSILTQECNTPHPQLSDCNSDLSSSSLFAVEQLSDYNLDCYWPDLLTTSSCSSCSINIPRCFLISLLVERSINIRCRDFMSVLYHCPGDGTWRNEGWQSWQAAGRSYLVLKMTWNNRIHM